MQLGTRHRETRVFEGETRGFADAGVTDAGIADAGLASQEWQTRE